MKSEAKMSSMSQNSGSYRKHVCYCGIESPLVTSWSVSNPGRRFFGCSNFGRPDACDFFKWFDPPTQPDATGAGATTIILDLLSKVERIERERERAVEREREMERERERARERERERERARNDNWNTLLFILILAIVVGWIMKL